MGIFDPIRLLSPPGDIGHCNFARLTGKFRLISGTLENALFQSEKERGTRD